MTSSTQFQKPQIQRPVICTVHFLLYQFVLKFVFRKGEYPKETGRWTFHWNVCTIKRLNQHWFHIYLFYKPDVWQQTTYLIFTTKLLDLNKWMVGFKRIFLDIKLEKWGSRFNLTTRNIVCLSACYANALTRCISIWQNAMNCSWWKDNFHLNQGSLWRGPWKSVYITVSNQEMYRRIQNIRIFHVKIPILTF